MAEKRIILIRHGQSTSDIENRYGGDYDDHLTPKGRKQAERLADQILKEGIKIEKIFTSPRKRASETADILNRKLKSGVFVVKGMRERNAYGILTGMKKQAAKKRYPKLVEQLSDPLITIRGAENYDHFKNRILGALGRLANTKYKTIILVTHGGPIRCMFRELMKKEFRNMGDCSIIELEKRGRGLKLVRMENAELED